MRKSSQQNLIDIPPNTKLSTAGGVGLLSVSVEVVVIVQPLADAMLFRSRIAPATSLEPEPRYNAWGKPITEKSISNAITRIQELWQQVALDKTSIRSMIEEGRRF